MVLGDNHQGPLTFSRWPPPLFDRTMVQGRPDNGARASPPQAVHASHASRTPSSRAARRKSRPAPPRLGARQPAVQRGAGRNGRLGYGHPRGARAHRHRLGGPRVVPQSSRGRGDRLASRRRYRPAGSPRPPYRRARGRQERPRHGPQRRRDLPDGARPDPDEEQPRVGCRHHGGAGHAPRPPRRRRGGARELPGDGRRRRFGARGGGSRLGGAHGRARIRARGGAHARSGAERARSGPGRACGLRARPARGGGAAREASAPPARPRRAGPERRPGGRAPRHAVARRGTGPGRRRHSRDAERRIGAPGPLRPGARPPARKRGGRARRAVVRRAAEAGGRYEPVTGEGATRGRFDHERDGVDRGTGRTAAPRGSRPLVGQLRGACGRGERGGGVGLDRDARAAGGRCSRRDLVEPR